MTVGCDYGSRRLALFRLETAEGFTFTLPKIRRKQWEDRPAALRSFALYVAELVPDSEPLWLEAAISGRTANNLDTAIKMAQTSGAVCGAHTLTYLVHQATWKKGVCGDGHADKAAVRAWLDTHRPALAEACRGDQDLYDAACIALFGRSVAEGRLEVPRKLQRRRSRPVLRARQCADAERAGTSGEGSVP